MAKTSIIFMGFGEIGIFCLDRLIEQCADIRGIFPRASDRQITDRSRSLFTHASRLGLNIYPYTDPSDPVFLQHVAQESPDYIVSVQYDRILKPPLIRLPREGVLNLHFAPLPRLRGCFPTKWAIINNESSGVTLHYIDPGIDTGAIIDQTVVPLTRDETDYTLYGRLVEAGKALFAKNAQRIVSRTLPQAELQDNGHASYYPKAVPHNGIIDWSRGAEWAERFIRAFTFPPHPAAKTFYGPEEIQIRFPVQISAQDTGLSPGEFIFSAQNEILVSCGNDALRVQHILHAGRNVPVSELQSMGVQKNKFGSQSDA